MEDESKNFTGVTGHLSPSLLQTQFCKTSDSWSLKILFKAIGKKGCKSEFTSVEAKHWRVLMSWREETRRPFVFTSWIQPDKK